jgi:hypothetical protein
VAWKARVSGIKENEDSINVAVEYFNDTNPTKVFATRDFHFAGDMPAAEGDALIQAEGLGIRRNRQLVNQLASAYQVGKEITI